MRRIVCSKALSGSKKNHDLTTVSPALSEAHLEWLREAGSSEFSGNESAGRCTTWPVLGCYTRSVWGTGRGMKLLVVRWAVWGRQMGKQLCWLRGAVATQEGSTEWILLPRQWRGLLFGWLFRAPQTFPATGILGSSSFPRTIWGLYIPDPRTKCQSTLHPQGHFQTLPELKAQE